MAKPPYAPITPGVTLIDCDYVRPRFASAYLVENSGKALFVDNGTAHSVPLLLAALSSAGRSPSDVEYLVVTHIHLDHAGGTSALAQACPKATIVAHPRAAPHLIDPTKLVASARGVYGDAIFTKLYGTIEAIPESRVRVTADEEEIPFGDASLRFIHTRGHANHHHSMIYQSAIFTGDAFGLAYPDLQEKGLFIFPSTSPTDFNAEEARKSIDRIAASGAKEALPTHFGSVRDLTAAAKQLRLSIDGSDRIVKTAIDRKLLGSELQKYCRTEVYREMDAHLTRAGIEKTKRVEEFLKLDLDINAQGLAHVVRKAMQEPHKP